MDKLRGCMGMEIPLFLYMLTSYLKYPVFQNLMYEKICLTKYDHDMSLCANVTAYHKDKTIQADANHFYFLSSVVLTLPSLFTTLVLGAASDLWSIKIPLLIPFVGLILGTTNYIIQTSYVDTSIYLLLISDALFGICGGYISIISAALSYGVKTTSTSRKSVRIAGVESAIGLGGTFGYAFSGTVREALGYSYTFLLMLILQVIAFLYIVIFAEDSLEHAASNVRTNSGGILQRIQRELVRAFTDYRDVLTVRRRFHSLLLMNLLAFGLELFIFAGLMDIQFSYLRFKLGWDDKQYGWFSGLQFAVTTAMVMVAYPLLFIQGYSDGVLGCLGLFSKIISLVMLAFVKSTTMAYSIIGKVFSFIALLQGVTGLIATAVFNNLYPRTLAVFPGLLYLLSAVLLTVSLIILGISDRVVNSTINTNRTSSNEELS